ncbi:DUF2378 family protein [Hyalangium rubrum]|uniref:DUF2378 family protein n=1 Tax=Hyalangium rubrum TaxID=3103134 RepID=A0ABU5H6I8_9BACT|nr:DUF2378 family protein [Hyalangium sp. s54d21]MDY7228960.1 DUF2378 family protein [Hyalangium sp. s54d21]
MARLTEPQLVGNRPSGALQRPVVFEHTVEGLFHIALKDRLSRMAVASLKREGLDLSQKLLPAYPVEIWRRCLAIAVADLYPVVSRAEGYRRLGHDVVEGMVRTVLGRAVVGVARLLGPLRALRRLDHNLHSADNYVRAKLVELTPTWCEVSINEVLEQPTYYQGILEACLKIAGAQEIRVELISREGSGATYRVQWAE